MSMGGISPDGLFTLQWTNDIGMADQEPAALINGIILTELTPADVPWILTAIRQAGKTGGMPAYPPHAGDAAKLPKSRVAEPCQDRPFADRPRAGGKGSKLRSPSRQTQSSQRSPTPSSAGAAAPAFRPA